MVEVPGPASRKRELEDVEEEPPKKRQALREGEEGGLYPPGDWHAHFVAKTGARMKAEEERRKEKEQDDEKIKTMEKTKEEMGGEKTTPSILEERHPQKKDDERKEDNSADGEKEITLNNTEVSCFMCLNLECLIDSL